MVSPWSMLGATLNGWRVLGEVGGRLGGVSAHRLDRGLVGQRLAAGDQITQVAEVPDVQIGGEGVEDDGGAVGGVGEGMRRARRYHDQGSGGRVVDRLADGEPRGAGYHVKALVVPGVTVLRRSVGVRGEGDLTDPEPVSGARAVLQDPHQGRTELAGLTP